MQEILRHDCYWRNLLLVQEFPPAWLLQTELVFGLTVLVGTYIWLKNSPHNDMTVSDSEYKYILLVQEFSLARLFQTERVFGSRILPPK